MNPAKPAPDDDADDDQLDGEIVPRPRPGHQTRKAPLSVTVGRFAPVAAGVVRAVAGVLAFAGALLTLPIHFATPFLSGVGLLMLVGGCVAVVKESKALPQLRWFSMVFPIVCGLIVVGVGVTVAVYGPGVFAPNLRAEPPPARDDGTVRFQSG